MKRIIMGMAVLLMVAGLAMAQTAQATNAQTIVKVEGKLALINGYVGLQYKDKTYYVDLPNYLYGFVDGLKEGAQVKLEGYDFSSEKTPTYVQLHVTKLTFNGKDYDLSQLDGGRRGMGMGMGMGEGFGAGNRGDGPMGQDRRGRMGGRD
jgi:opacity protein-like surface antigen